jgi:protein TonB
MNIKRILTASALAIGVTFGLFGLMVSLIESGDKNLDDGGDNNLTNILMEDREITDNTKSSKPKKPKQDEPPPEMPKPEFDDVELDDSIETIAIDFAGDLDIGLSGVSASDGEYLPIVKVAPQYPRRAASKGIQGYVILSFTVTKLGTVIDPVVLEAKPTGYFERAAKKAVKRFKYKPTIIDGIAMDVPGVKNKIVFKLAD